jgi:hypothetical protein
MYRMNSFYGSKTIFEKRNKKSAQQLERTPYKKERRLKKYLLKC